jgi:hypothetical protein
MIRAMERWHLGTRCNYYEVEAVGAILRKRICRSWWLVWLSFP